MEFSGSCRVVSEAIKSVSSSEHHDDRGHYSSTDPSCDSLPMLSDVHRANQNSLIAGELHTAEAARLPLSGSCEVDSQYISHSKKIARGDPHRAIQVPEAGPALAGGIQCTGIIHRPSRSTAGASVPFIWVASVASKGGESALCFFKAIPFCLQSVLRPNHSELLLDRPRNTTIYSPLVTDLWRSSSLKWTTLCGVRVSNVPAPTHEGIPVRDISSHGRRSCHVPVGLMRST
jgi:hypothetical protein